MSKKKKKPVKASKKTPNKVAKKEPEKEPKKKKKHKGLIVLSVLFCIFIVFPIAFVFIAFFDTTTKNVSNREVTYQNIVSEAFYNGLNNLSEDNPKLDFTINEEMIDGILMAGCEKINQPTYIPKMYCYIDDNRYTFAMDVTASFFKTRALLHTTLDTVGESKNETLTFQINGMTLGRLPIPINWITGILGNFINDDTINRAFEQARFHIKSHLSEAKLTYAREDFKNDVGFYLSDLGNDNPILNILLTMFGDEEHNILSTNFHDGVTATFNLENMTPKMSPHKEPAPLNFINLGGHKLFINECLNKGYLDEEDAATLFTYLIRGYDSASKTLIDDINDNLDKANLKKSIMEYLNVLDITQYEGSYIDGDVGAYRFQDYSSDTIDCTLTPKIDISKSEYGMTFEINKNDINSYLAFTMTSAIGKTIQISFLDKQKWGFEYIVVDNIYVGFEDDGEDKDPKMIVYLQLNVSSKLKLLLTVSTNNIRIVETDPDNGQIGKLAFDLIDINFGNVPITDSTFKNYILDLLPNPDDPESEEEFFSYKDDTFYINLDPIAGSQLPKEQTTKELILKAVQDKADDFEIEIKDDGTLNLNFTEIIQP